MPHYEQSVQMAVSRPGVGPGCFGESFRYACIDVVGLLVAEAGVLLHASRCPRCFNLASDTNVDNVFDSICMRFGILMVAG